MRILSIDGGGILGLIPAMVLAEIEGRAGCAAGKLFDLVAGTSTGGIIACAVAAGIPARQAAELYRQRGGAIFARNMGHRIATGFGLWGPQYTAEGIETALHGVFGDRRMSDCDAAELLVPTYDIGARSPVLFKSAKRSGLGSEYARILRELRPRYAGVENVKALLGRGLDRVLGDLAEIGYNAEWDVFPAAAFGAPHLRERVILVAYPGGDRGPTRAPILAPGGDLAIHRQPDGPVDWNGLRLAGPRVQAAVSAYRSPVVCRVDDGGPHWMDRLRCLGNGITPAVLQWVLDRVIATNKVA